MKPIPAIWRIDIEPDGFQPGNGLPPWNGFIATFQLVERLRQRIADASGAALHVSWFLRLDPGIEQWYGRPDFVVERYHDLLEKLQSHGDSLGIHVHFYRWDEERQVSYSDHADGTWIERCVETAVGTFERCFGERPRRSSQGGFFLSDEAVNRCAAAGVEVDVTVEPGYSAQSEAATFGAYATAPSTEFRNFPRYPYYPSRSRVSTPAMSSTDAQSILLVPLTAYDYNRAAESWPRRLAKHLLRWPYKPQPLNPWKQWSSPRRYWDLIVRAADEGPARYVAFAVRTELPESQSFKNALPLFESLVEHPIASRLRFVDPLSQEIRTLAQAQTQGWTSREGAAR